LRVTKMTRKNDKVTKQVVPYSQIYALPR
jgi:hypothetical protein